MLKQKSRLKAKSGVDLTPMVDVVFLLIIFFMTSSTLVKINALKVDLPEASSAQSEIQDQITLTIRSDGSLYVNQQEIAPNNIEAYLKELTADREEPIVIIEGDKNVAYQDIISLMSLAKKTGVARVSLATRARNP